MNDDIDNMNDSDDLIKGYDKELASGDKAELNTTIRRRIDELLEKKRLKDLLVDTDDWDL